MRRRITILIPLSFIASSIILLPAYPVENEISFKAADFICVKAREGKKTRLAIYPFTAKDGSTSTDTEMYATKIIEVILTKGEFRVIDPAKVSKIVEEQEKGLTGLVDPDTAPETGKMIGADAMIFGLTGDGMIQIRIVDAATGEVLGATVTDSGDSAEISNDDFKSGSNKNRFLTEQMESRLGQLYIQNPGMFLFVTADKEEMAEMKNSFPGLTKNTGEKLRDRDRKKIKRFNERKKKLLLIRKEDPLFDRKIRDMREKAILKMRPKQEKIKKEEAISNKGYMAFQHARVHR